MHNWKLIALRVKWGFIQCLSKAVVIKSKWLLAAVFTGQACVENLIRIGRRENYRCLTIGYRKAVMIKCIYFC